MNEIPPDMESPHFDEDDEPSARRGAFAGYAIIAAVFLFIVLAVRGAFCGV